MAKKKEIKKAVKASVKSQPKVTEAEKSKAQSIGIIVIGLLLLVAMVMDYAKSDKEIKKLKDQFVEVEYLNCSQIATTYESNEMELIDYIDRIDDVCSSIGDQHIRRDRIRAYRSSNYSRVGYNFDRKSYYIAEPNIETCHLTLAAPTGSLEETAEIDVRGSCSKLEDLSI